MRLFGDEDSDDDDAQVGRGRIVISEMEAPILLVNMV
jgi:hypothetical protein